MENNGILRKKEHPSVLCVFFCRSICQMSKCFTCLFSVLPCFFVSFCLSLYLSSASVLSFSLSFCFSLPLSLILFLSAPLSVSFSVSLSLCLSLPILVFLFSLSSIPILSPSLANSPHYMYISCQFKLFIYPAKRKSFFYFRIGGNLCKQYDHSMKELTFGKWIFIKFTQLMFV